jgi:hypothetical protein
MISVAYQLEQDYCTRNFMPAHKKEMASTSVPIRGNSFTRLALRDLAAEKHMLVADLVYDALCSIHGKRLRELYQFHYAQSASQSDQAHHTMCKDNSE